MISNFIIAGEKVEPGQSKQIDIRLSRLPTRTPIDIPVMVSRSKREGPTLLLMAGMHGDEINGVEIVRRLLVNGFNQPLIGSTICIPILNIHGFLNFSRQVPDGKDVNRSFPGSKLGSLASQIAYNLRSEILPIIDCGLDFHTGGSRINNYPQVRGDMSSEETLSIAKAFGCKYLMDAGLREKSFRREAGKLNKPLLIFEGGESLRLRKNAIDEGVNGALRVMKHLGMREEAPKPQNEAIRIASSFWIRSSAAGLYHSLVRPGERVVKGQEIGVISGPFGDFQRKMVSKEAGHVVAVNNIPVVNKGDALIHVGLE